MLAAVIPEDNTILVPRNVPDDILLALIPPLTSSACCGLLVAIPTLPPEK